MRLIDTIRRFNKQEALQPAVHIQNFGQRTSQPKVSVSVASRGGTQGVYCYPATAAGDAQAEMYAKGLAAITGLPLVDNRDIRDWKQDAPNEHFGDEPPLPPDQHPLHNRVKQFFYLLLRDVPESQGHAPRILEVINDAEARYSNQDIASAAEIHTFSLLRKR